MHFSATAVTEAATRVARLLAKDPDGITVGQVREALGTSRKWAVPLLSRALDEPSAFEDLDGELNRAVPRSTA